MTRVLSALALLPVVLGVIWFLPPLVTVLLAELVLLFAFVEYADLTTRLGAGYPRIPAAVAVLGTGAAFSLAPATFPVVLMAATLVIGMVQLAHGPPRGMLPGAAAAGFALLYLAIPLGAMAAIRMSAGRETILLLLAVIVASDTTQYYGGRLLGRHPLAPTVSPKKTVEGAVFGFATGAVVMLWVGRWWLPAVEPVPRVFLGATLAGLGIVGDLFESKLKRAAEMKDASSLIPGHGGVLDRIDGLLFAAPLYYTVVQLTG